MEHHIQFDDAQGVLKLLDQRYLPTREEWFICRDTDDIVEALQVMVVRGAPAIGVTAGYGCWLAVREAMVAGDGWRKRLDELLDKLEHARPTAVNLRWAVERMRAIWKREEGWSAEGLADTYLEEAKAMHAQDIAINKLMGAYGADLMDEGDAVMTHCNAGALATAGYGTALGVIRAAHEQGKKVTVVANETRPFLQGARLTAYELMAEDIPVTVACDNACGLLMRKGQVDKVVVGADRVAANGDVANKIGTYSVAVLAQRHGVPFYVAAPSSTFDLRCPTGDDIPIEERTPREVTHPTNETSITPEGAAVYNYAFDITPAELVTAFITEKGVIRPPYEKNIREALED